MAFSSPLFWCIILFLVVLVWFDGIATGRSLKDELPGKPSLWQRTGTFFRRFVKKPTTGKIVGLFLLVLVLRLLLGLLPLLMFLLAAWAMR
ncbi:MAG: hypothetical protein U0796_09335 [Gemmatales bacterium]